MRRRLPTLLLGALLFSLLAGCGEDVAKMQSPVLAQVGKTNITVAQYSDTMARNGQSFVEQTGSTPEQARQYFYDNLILEEIFLNEARRAGGGVDAETAVQVDQIISSNTKPVGKGITFADYQTLATTYNFGSINDIRTFLARQVTLDTYARTLHVEGAPEKLNVRNIVLTVKPDQGDQASAEVKKQADEIVAQLRAGADFATLAGTYSTDPRGKENGGVLGVIDLEQAPPEFKQVLENLPTGQISDPVQTPDGWYIFEVTDRVAFAGWQDMQQSPAGQAYTQQKMAEYSASGELKPYIKVEDLPLPVVSQ